MGVAGKLSFGVSIAASLLFGMMNLRPWVRTNIGLQVPVESEANDGKSWPEPLAPALLKLKATVPLG